MTPIYATYVFLWNLWIFQKQPSELFYEKKLFFKISQYQKETPTLAFSPEYCENLKNTFFEEHLLTAASHFFKNS